MKKIKNKILSILMQIVGAEGYEFIMHAKNYISGDLLTKGLTFLCIPLLTYLLTPAEFGIMSVFISSVTIFSIIFRLNMNGSVIRYYFEENGNFPVFLGSNLIFLLIFNVFILVVFWIFKDSVDVFFQIGPNILFAAVIAGSMDGFLQMYLGYLRSQNKSGEYARLEIARNIAILLLSIVIMYLLSDKRYLGRVFSQIGILTILMFYLGKKFATIAVFKIEKDKIKYALLFSLPLVLHSLSGVILTHFDKIIINQLTGPAEAGLYSFAYQIGMIMNVIITGMNTSWNPIFYEKMSKNDFKGISSLINQFQIYIYYIAIVLILTIKEPILMFTNKNYHSAFSIIPLIILSYVFTFLYSTYSNYSMYYKKTSMLAGITVITGIFNVLINYQLIPRFGYKIAAVTTLASYILLFVLIYLNNRILLKLKNMIKLSEMLPDISYILIAIGFYYLVDMYNLSLFYAFIIKIMALFLITFILFRKHVWKKKLLNK